MLLLYVVFPFIVTTSKYYRAAFCAVVCEKCVFWLFNQAIKGKEKPVTLAVIPSLTLYFRTWGRASLVLCNSPCPGLWLHLF